VCHFPQFLTQMETAQRDQAFVPCLSGTFRRLLQRRHLSAVLQLTVGVLRCPVLVKSLRRRSLLGHFPQFLTPMETAPRCRAFVLCLRGTLRRLLPRRHLSAVLQLAVGVLCCPVLVESLRRRSHPFRACRRALATPKRTAAA